MQSAPQGYGRQMSWPRPSPAVRELIRQCAQIVVNARAEWLDELDASVLAASPTIAADPELAAAVSRSNRANLFFWGTANVRDPGAPVPHNTGPEPLTIAREVVRRGLDAYSLDAYRVGEAVAWRRLMDIAFELTSDPAELRELLEAHSRSIISFSDATLMTIAAQIDAEQRAFLQDYYGRHLQATSDLSQKACCTDSTHARHAETIALIPDEVVAQGAAIQAHNLTHSAAVRSGSGRSGSAPESSALLIDVTPQSLGVGTVGGFCVSNHPKFEIMRLVCRPYVFPASLPPSVVATAETSIRKLMHGSNKRAHLWENSKTLHKGLKELGFQLGTELFTHIGQQFEGVGDHAVVGQQTLFFDGRA